MHTYVILEYLLGYFSYEFYTVACNTIYVAVINVKNYAIMDV